MAIKITAKRGDSFCEELRNTEGIPAGIPNYFHEAWRKLEANDSRWRASLPRIASGRINVYFGVEFLGRDETFTSHFAVWRCIVAGNVPEMDPRDVWESRERDGFYLKYIVTIYEFDDGELENTVDFFSVDS